MHVHTRTQTYKYTHRSRCTYTYTLVEVCAPTDIAVHLAIIERVAIQQILQRDVYVHMDMCVYLYVYLAIIEGVGIQQVLLWPNVLGVHALHLYA